jgi:alpha-galactosidase
VAAIQERIHLFRRRSILASTAFVTAAVLVVVAAAIDPVPGSGASGDTVSRTGGAAGRFAPALPPYAVIPYGNGLALTPPMGWNPYNHFGRGATADTVRAMARALVTSGMKSLGYTYVNVDGGWDLKQRDANDELQPDPAKFPQGIKPVADYVHALGLKFGIYTSAGAKNCANTSAGSYGHYRQDAALFASWGVDYVKLDWCYIPFRLYPYMSAAQLSENLAKKFADAMAASGRQMVLDLNDPDPGSLVAAPQLANMWRVAPDIRDSYSSMVANFIRDVGRYRMAGPDHWNDPDMLEVGNGGMTLNEQRTEFTLWAELAAPLIAGNDLTHMSHEVFSILTNAAVIAVDQDALGAQGYPVTNRDGRWVLTKPLASGDRAVVLFNQTNRNATISTTIGAIGLAGAPDYQLRNLWTGAVVTTRGSISVAVPAHGVVMYLVSPIA